MSHKKKLTKIVCSLVILSPIIAILHLYCSIPAQITLACGGSYTYRLQPFTTLKSSQDKILAETSNISQGFITSLGKNTNINANNIGNYVLSLKLFDAIPLKKINVVVTPKHYVVASGEPIGVKLYTDGILVVGISYVTAQNGENVFPAKEAGLKEGDRIISINGVKISSIEEMSERINASNGNLTLSVERDNTISEIKIKAVRSKNDHSYKLGIWVRDTAAGVGTMTFYDPETKKFASLGHAITDVDTGDVLKVLKGSIISCNIVSVTKGQKGSPGELIGSFTNKDIGKIQLNTPLGIYGSVEDTEYFSGKPEIEVATRFQINEGSAYILADTDGAGVKAYSVEIQKIARDATQNNKGIIFKVTDRDLIEKTGGIVQGMSGCPIIQNDMLVGAVTHVFVNDPLKGYGIFAENMIDKIYELAE
ncbi:MAG: SpoIVB peptidase [Clostridia bacterium]|nr:SpoIVB peptidase [Clostridia bacterium]